MVNQTQKMRDLNNGHHGHEGLGRSIAHLKDDVVVLAELQWRLFVCDCGSVMRRIRWPALVIAVGAILAGCAVPIALLGVAYLLMRTGLEMEWALLSVAGGTALVGLIAAYVAVRAASRAMQGFDRSKSELRSNAEWLKQAVRAATTKDAVHQ